MTAQPSNQQYNSNFVEWVSTPEQREEAWRNCAKTIQTHFEERVKRWNAELDMLLVFAGLFSTALTAFIVQAYPLLQPNDADTVILALAYLSSQVDSFSLSSSFVNSTQRSPFVSADATFTAPKYAVWINALWFSSLVCTLSASSIAVLVKQWLHQCTHGLSGTSQEVARLRQYRYDSLLKWRVPEIIAALPMLLQVALALFLSGLLILLWTLHPSVAISATALVGLLFLFITMTSCYPVFHPDCCYQTPQALAAFFFAQGVAQCFAKLLREVERLTDQAAHDTRSWTSRKYVILARIRDATKCSLEHLSTMGSFRDWHTREKPDAEAKESELDQSLALSAYYITLDNSALNTTVIPCLSGMDALSERMSVRYGELLGDVTEKITVGEWKAWRPMMPFVLIVLSLITSEPKRGAIKKVLQAMPKHPLSPARSKLGMLHFLAMSQLVSRGIAAREAFQSILTYIQYARLDAERNPIIGASVLGDVEATFPADDAELQERVDLDVFESISLYLTGVEYIVRYLLRHRDRLEQDGSSVPDRIKGLLHGFTKFLNAEAWRLRRTRQETVLWALRYSQLPQLISQVERDIPMEGPKSKSFVDAAVHSLNEAVSVIENSFIACGHGVTQPVPRGAKRAFGHVRTALQEMNRSVKESRQAQIAANAAKADRESGPPPNDLSNTNEKPAETTPVAGPSQRPPIEPGHLSRSESLDILSSPEEAADILSSWAGQLKSSNDDTADLEDQPGIPITEAEPPDSPLPDPAMSRLNDRARSHVRTNNRHSRLNRSTSPSIARDRVRFERRSLPPIPQSTILAVPQPCILPGRDVHNARFSGEQTRALPPEELV